jgi:hypothetical protein
MHGDRQRWERGWKRYIKALKMTLAAMFAVVNEN